MTWKFWLALFIIFLPTIVFAQTEATSDQSVAWDYSDTNIQQFNVARFEARYNGGNPLDAGFNRYMGMEAYVTPLPALTTGDYIANIRACRAEVDSCGDWSVDLNFSISVFTAPTNLRIVDTPQ